MKPDDVDVRILEALMKDARASFSEIARRTSLTTPTVSARVARMTKAGLIRKFVPLLSGDSVSRGVLCLLVLKAGASSGDRLARELARYPEVEEVYRTADQSVALKVALDDVRELQPFLKRTVGGKADLEVISSQVVTGVVKEEPPTRIPKVMEMNLKCDYCRGEISSGRPYSILAGPSRYYFCCKTCKRRYVEQHGARLAKLPPP